MDLKGYFEKIEKSDCPDDCTFKYKREIEIVGEQSGLLTQYMRSRLCPPPPAAISSALTRPPFPLNLKTCAQLLYDACGGLGWLWVLPVGGMAVKIYNL